MIHIFLFLAVSAEAAPAVLPAEKPQLICREGERETGSHIHSTRRCLTAEQWQMEDARRDRIPISAKVGADPDDAARAATRPH